MRHENDLCTPSTGLDFTRQLQAVGMEVLKPPTFAPGQFQVATLRFIKRSGIRCVMLLAYDPEEMVVSASAALEGTNTGHAWILTETIMKAPATSQGWLFAQLALPSGNTEAFANQVECTATHILVYLLLVHKMWTSCTARLCSTR